jgi:two-component system, OmpR family, response regulator
LIINKIICVFESDTQAQNNYAKWYMAEKINLSGLELYECESGYNVSKDLCDEQILSISGTYCPIFIYLRLINRNFMPFGKAKKIFIVDDDPFMQESLKDYLTREVPHHVSVFNTGEECLKHLSEKPDIIILDYHLNSQSKDAASGMEILKTIKKHYPAVPVVMLSSQDKYAVAMQTIQKGAEHYVIKDKEAFEKIAAMVREMN